jgi:hypothetical protein
MVNWLLFEEGFFSAVLFCPIFCVFQFEMILQAVVSSHHKTEVAKDVEKIDRVRGLTASKKGPRMEALSQRVRLSILKRIRHTRTGST